MKILDKIDMYLAEAKWSVRYLDKNKKMVFQKGTMGAGGSQITAPNALKAIKSAADNINDFPGTEKIQLFKDTKKSSVLYGTWDPKIQKFEGPK